ncbi:MAG: hypothetical protein IH934_01170 [Nanoarchaeota archaeon]|nr:hypothetical protein [Nanoarchaeota archaeon]
MAIKIFSWIVYVLFFLILMNFVSAQSEIINLNNLKNIAIPIHLFELVLALFIAFMSLKFFRITKPISLFLFIYVAVGFFIINSLLYLFFYLSIDTRLEMVFVNVHIGSRVALMGMLISFVIFFYQWNKIMRRTDIK